MKLLMLFTKTEQGRAGNIAALEQSITVILLLWNSAQLLILLFAELCSAVNTVVVEQGTAVTIVL